MKRNTIALAATSGLVGLTVLGGSMAYAAASSDHGSSARLQGFLKANPAVAAAVADVEAKTGGTVHYAKFEHRNQGTGLVDFDVMMADGTEQNVLYTLADGKMTVQTDDDGGENEGSDN